MNSSLKRHKQAWDTLGEMDPFWAVLTDPKGKFGGWDVDAFFGTGEKQIAQVMSEATRLGCPAHRDSALDFGCGVGRLTRALGKHFRQAVGIDISESMIGKARELNKAFPNCEFRVNASNKLEMFPDDHFDMIYTAIVLQHLPKRSMILAYIAEFQRVLRPGGLLIFQVPCQIPWRNRLQPRRRLYGLLRACGIQDKFLYNKMNLSPMIMNAVPEKHVRNLLDG